MMHGRNNGKKLMAVRIVAHAFEIVSLLPERRQAWAGALLHMPMAGRRGRIKDGKC